MIINEREVGRPHRAVSVTTEGQAPISTTTTTTTTTVTSTVHRRRWSLGRVLVVLTVPAAMAAGCTRVSDDPADAGVTDPAPAATASPPDASEVVTTDPAPVDTSDAPPESSAPTTATGPPSTDSSAPVPDSTPVDPDDADDGDDSSSSGAGGDVADGDADGDDGDSGDDSWPVTIAAIIGAGVLVLVAIAWMLRMSRTNDDDGGPPAAQPGAGEPGVW